MLPEPWVWVKVGLTLVCNSSTSLGICSSAEIKRTWNLEKESLALSEDSLFPWKIWIFHKQTIDQNLCVNPTEFTQEETKTVVAVILKAPELWNRRWELFYNFFHCPIACCCWTVRILVKTWFYENLEKIIMMRLIHWVFP